MAARRLLNGRTRLLRHHALGGRGIIPSSVATRYQLGLLRHAASLIVPLRASTPQGTCESAMNAASSALKSAANEAGIISRLGDHRSAIGMANEDDRSALLADDHLGRGDVALE